MALLVGLGALVAGCSNTETAATLASPTSTTAAVTTTAASTTTQSVTTTTEVPTTTTEVLASMSAAEISQWETEASVFAARFLAAFPDADAQLADFADDSIFYDPCSAYQCEGKQSILTMQRDFNYYNMRGAKWYAKAVCVSRGAAALTTVMENAWPPFYPEPENHPPWVDLEVFRFTDGQVDSFEIWNSVPSLELATYGFLAPGEGGSEQLQEMVDRYLGAWASGDPAQIAALYHPDASFSDTMLGLQAQGAEAISGLGEERFGTGPISFEVIELHAQTNGWEHLDDQHPQQGAIIGVGIHYRCKLVVDGKHSTLEALSTFELGTRHEGSSLLFDFDPDGLITREEVFYDADSLLASGLVQ